jgi:DNA polymerase I
MIGDLHHYCEIWLVDFEFTNLPGERPVPVCMVAREFSSNRLVRTFENGFESAPPFAIDAGALFVAYYASAELGCFRALGWPMPARILDLCAEYKLHRSGLRRKDEQARLLDALAHFGLDAIDAVEKGEMQKAIGSGTWHGRYSEEEILDYCQTDVDALARLLPVMLPRIDLPRALFRGRYMAAAAAIEWAGSPIDTPMLGLFREHWTGIQDQLIEKIDAGYGVFDGRTFKVSRWANFLERNRIPWPRLESGQLDLEDKTFREMAKTYSIVSPMRELRHALSALRLDKLAVGHDSRNRVLLGAFGSKTGRNQPSSNKNIFGSSVWLRGLIKPPPGYGICYIDEASQEFGIAAVLSGDSAMLAAYETGDPYLAFGKQIGLIPAEGTKDTHGPERELCKQCILGISYGMGEETLALRIGQPVIVARDLLRAHRRTYPKFWAWSDGAVDRAMLTSSLSTVLGWHVHVGPDTNPRSLMNFPMQATGADMMRIWCCLGTERGVEICASIHDATLICAPLNRIEEDTAKMRAAMAEASRLVLNGYEIRTDVKRVDHPHRYMDKRGRKMWRTVVSLVAKMRRGKIENALAA